MISESDVDETVNLLRDNADSDAEKRAHRLYMEQWVKTVLAQEQAKSSASSVAAAEIEARQSTAYREALQAYKESIEADEKARFLRSACETKIDVWRTMAANKRHEVI